jgi:hypothetical protein
VTLRYQLAAETKRSPEYVHAVTARVSTRDGPYLCILYEAQLIVDTRTWHTGCLILEELESLILRENLLLEVLHDTVQGVSLVELFKGR